MDNSKEGKASQKKSHTKMTERENKTEAGTSSKIVENFNNKYNNSVSVSVSGNETSTNDKCDKKETVEVDSNRQSSQLKNVEDCAPLNRTNEAREHLDKEMQLKSEEPKASSSKMEAEEEVLRKRCDELGAAGQRTNEAREHLDKENQLKSENPKASSSKMEVEEDVLRKECDKLGAAGQEINKVDECLDEQQLHVKMEEPKESFPKRVNLNKSADAASIQDEQTTFNKRVGAGGISGQLYEIYLVLLILLHGLTNKNITHFHLASNLKEAGDFDDVVFSYAYKDNGAEKFKVIFLQAKHKEKSKNITLEELLGKTGKGAFDLKKYFKSFREIKEHFKGNHPSHPIFGRNFNECEFIIYTNASLKIGYTEEGNIYELCAEVDYVLNFRGNTMKYHQLHISDKKDDRIKKYLGNVSESDIHEFQEFLSKLKICSTQPNQEELTDIIKEKMQSNYGVTRSDTETIFSVVKTKVEKWWKDSSEYLTKQNTFIQDAARVSIRFEVQDPVPSFTGREQTLRDLHEALQTTGHSLISQSASITGLGGIGKTELARKYVSEYGQHYDNNIIWINAETYATCSESFRRLAGDALEIGILNKDGKEKDISVIITEVYAFFAKPGRKSLFIFDNAEISHVNEKQNVQQFLPSGNNKPHVLITSRDQQWEGIKSLQLDLFTEEESVQFITRYLSERRIKLKECEVKSLGEKLQYLPLALQQAVAYIAMENERLMKWKESYTIGNYLKEFEDKAKELLDKAPQHVYDRYAKTVFTTWQVTIEKIRRNEKYGMIALFMLNIIAFFSPDNIPVVVIFEKTMDTELIRSCVEILEKYSMVKLIDGEVSIHRLLQQVIRIMLKNEGEEEVMIKMALISCKNIIPNCVIHARTVWDYAKDFNELVQEFSYFPLAIIVVLAIDIKYNEAYLFGMMTYTLFKEKLEDDHVNTLEVLNMIGLILNGQGKYQESVIRLEEVLCKRKKIVGLDHPETLKTWHSLAEALYNQGKREESIIQYQKVLEKRKKILKLDHPDTLMTMHNLALAYSSQGKFEKSLILSQEVLEKQKKTIGVDHLDSISTMTNIALIHSLQGKLEESFSLYQSVLNKQKEILIQDHPDILKTMHNMASVLKEQKKYDESLILYQQVLEKQIKVLDPDHPSTLITLTNMASLLHHQGNYKQSVIEYQKLLHKQKIACGLNHPATLTTMDGLAAVFYTLGKYEDALYLSQELLCKKKEVLGPNHPDTLSVMQNLARVLIMLEKYEESLILHQELLCKQTELLGPDHPKSLNTMRKIEFLKFITP